LRSIKKYWGYHSKRNLE